MARNQSENSPTIKCPSCGNEDTETIKHQEFIPCLNDIQLVEGKILITGEGSNMIYDGAVNPSLTCDACYTDFPIPSGIDIQWG